MTDHVCSMSILLKIQANNPKLNTNLMISDKGLFFTSGFLCVMLPLRGSQSFHTPLITFFGNIGTAHQWRTHHIFKSFSIPIFGIPQIAPASRTFEQAHGASTASGLSTGRSLISDNRHPEALSSAQRFPHRFLRCRP